MTWAAVCASNKLSALNPSNAVTLLSPYLVVQHLHLRKYLCKHRQTQWMCDSSSNEQRHVVCVTVVHTYKTNTMKFITNNLSHSALHIGYKEQQIEEEVNMEFLGSQIDNHLNWKNHIE
jgi:hypothetical protein